MKALELTVYYAIPCGGPCQCDSYVLPSGDLVSVQSVNVEAKRLTDAELAAEAWAAQCNRRVRNYDPTRDIPGVTWEWEHNIMARFATLPHYDEVTA